MDGYTYVQNVLKADNNDVSILLLKLKKRENSAVEFKASFLPKARSGDDRDECSWNVISAIIAIANSAGGCVLIGVNNDGEYAEGFLQGGNGNKMDLDTYSRQLNDHISSKKSWSVKNKRIEIPQKYRLRLADCIEVKNGKLNEKEILIVHIKPSKKPIVYHEYKQDQSEPNKFLSYRSKAAIASKIQVPFDVEALEAFEDRETESEYFDLLWEEYSGKEKNSKLHLWIFSLAILAIIITVAQALLIYKGDDLPFKWVDDKFLILLASIPIFIVLDVFLKFVFRATRELLLCILTLFWMSFSISSFFYVLKLFNLGDAYGYSMAERVVIAIALLLGISVFCFFILPILVPNNYKKKDRIPGCPKPDDIIVKHSRTTIEWRCLDGGFWWTDSDRVITPYGDWKLQRHRFLGYFRILDPRRIMRCYGSQQEVLSEFNRIRSIYKEIDQ